MGSEFLIEPLKYLGAILFALLVYLSARPAARPFALPTLVAAVIWAWLDVKELHQPSHAWTRCLISFVAGAIQFGAFAYAVKWLLQHRQRGSRSEPE